MSDLVKNSPGVQESELPKETEMFENEEELIFNLSNDLICIAGMDGYFKYVNPAWEEILGYTKEELLSRPFLDFIHPDDHEKNNAEVQKLSGGNKTIDFENRYICKDGSIRHLLWTATPIPEKDIIYCIGHDITQRKQAQDQLIRSEQKYRSLFNSIRDAILVTDTNRNISDCNPAFIKLFEYDKNEILGKKTISVYADEKEFNEMGRELKEHYGSKPFFKTVHFKKKSGAIFPGETAVYYLEDQQGAITGFIGLIRDISDRRKAEEALAASERKYRRFFETSRDCVFITSKDGRWLDLNIAAVELFGYESKEALKKTRIPDLYADPEDRKKHIQKIEQTGFTNDYPVQLKKKDGSIMDTLITTVQIRDKKGAIYAFQGTIRDVTSEKRTERALRESEEKYRMIVENANDGIEITQNDRIIFANKRFAGMLGYTIDELKDIPFSEIFTDRACRELHERNEKRARDRKVSNYYETTFRRKDGTIIDVDVKYEITEYRGKPATFAIVRDITDRKQVQEKLKKSEEQFRVITENSADAIFIADENGNYQYTNKTASQLLGYSGNELKAMNIIDLTPKYLIDKSKKLIDRLLREGSLFTEIELQKKDGSIIATDLNAVVLPNGLIYGSCRDLSERKELEEKLYQSQKMQAVGQLAGGVAHDFNNLLTVIEGYSDMLLSGINHSHSHFEGLKQIKDAGNRAASLTRQLLAFSRKQILEPKILNLNESINNLEKMLGRLIGEDIELQTFLDSDIAQIKADPGQIEQIIINLSVNARDAMPKGGKLTIETDNLYLDEHYCQRHTGAKPGYYVVLTISDNGIGMNKETKERIFEPFFTTKAKEKGTGLGLSTVYGIVKQSGGNIWVYSEPGEGTVFKIYLPAMEKKTVAPAQKKDMHKKLTGSETLLVVEDETAVLAIIEDTLKKYGYNLITAKEGPEAIKKARKFKDTIDLLLSDVVMPEMSGKELSEEITKIHPETRVCFMSGYTDNAIVHHGVLDSEMNFIQKPFTAYKLAKKIRTVLDSGK